MEKAKARDQSWDRAGVAAAALLGAVWAAVPLLWAGPPAPESRFLIVAVLFAAMSVGSLVLAERRSSARAFCAMLTGVSAVTAAGAATPLGFALGFLAIAYGAALILVSGIARQKAAAIIAAGREIAERDGIISLSLKEDSGTFANWVFETDGGGVITSASAGLAAITGIPREDLAGRPFSELFAPENTGAGWNRLILAIGARQGVDCAVELVFEGRHLWWQIACRALSREDGSFAGHAGVAQNITAERLARQRLGEERDQALRENSKAAQLMEEVTQEIRPPLSTVMGFAEILNSPASRDLSEAERRTYNQLLLDCSRNLCAFLADVSDLLRLNREKLNLMEQEVDAAELAEIAMKFCQDAAEAADVTILVDVFDGVELRCDAIRIRRALATLVTRAVQASTAGSAVHVSFKRGVGGALVISISDRGRLLAADELQRIFEPAIAERGMAGLALPIARRNVMLHGGSVELESVQGIGTTPRLILPADRVTWTSGAVRPAIQAA